MTRNQKFAYIVDYFSKHQPDAQTELHYNNPFELLVAVILSAQCTDKRVNKITEKLFPQFPTPEVMANTTSEEIFEYIKSCSYPNNKAKHLVNMAKMLINEFGGKIPSDIKELQKLPGVGRKTANVIASVVFDKPAMAVDTHVFRVSHRLGLVPKNAKTPLEVEKQLVKHLPEDKIAVAHHWLILHGRYTCTAKKPKCDKCPLTEICDYYKKQIKL